jgi:hypothetical protein
MMPKNVGNVFIFKNLPKVDNLQMCGNLPNLVTQVPDPIYKAWRRGMAGIV